MPGFICIGCVLCWLWVLCQVRVLQTFSFCMQPISFMAPLFAVREYLTLSSSESRCYWYPHQIPFLDSLRIWLLYLFFYKTSNNNLYRTMLSQREPSHLEIAGSHPCSLLEWLRWMDGWRRIHKACALTSTRDNPEVVICAPEAGPQLIPFPSLTSCSAFSACRTSLKKWLTLAHPINVSYKNGPLCVLPVGNSVWNCHLSISLSRTVPFMYPEKFLCSLHHECTPLCSPSGLVGFDI